MYDIAEDDATVPLLARGTVADIVPINRDVVPGLQPDVADTRTENLV